MPLRYLLLLGCSLALTACVSSGKYKRTVLNYRAQVETLRDLTAVQQDSVRELSLSLERAWGGNDALLRTQDKLLDRLAAQEDQMDDLQGNLTNTSAKLTADLAKSRAATQAALASEDSLRTGQAAAIEDFQEGLSKASATLERTVAGTLQPDQFRLSISGGELRFSVREDVLFAPRAVGRLADGSQTVLDAIVEVLQNDPLLKLSIVGHTDNQPNPRRGANNWEYAALRATRLAEELTEAYFVSANRIVAASHGEFGPLTSNATEEGRATNRRVDFVFGTSVSNLLRELQKL